MFVAGYTCLLDITMRGERIVPRASPSTHSRRLGRQLVTPDEVGDLSALRLRTTVNGTLRQDAAIADLIWDVPRLISYASSVMTLLPGDVITTGTPAGVGPIVDGDHVTVEIDRVGALSVGRQRRRRRRVPDPRSRPWHTASCRDNAGPYVRLAACVTSPQIRWKVQENHDARDPHDRNRAGPRCCGWSKSPRPNRDPVRF